MIQNCKNNSYYLFKNSDGVAFILDSLIDYQKNLSTNYHQYLHSPPSFNPESITHPFESCIPNKVFY